MLCREVFGGIEIVFVGSAEADAFIAQEAHNLRKSGCPYVGLLLATCICSFSGRLFQLHERAELALWHRILI